MDNCTAVLQLSSSYEDSYSLLSLGRCVQCYHSVVLQGRMVTLKSMNERSMDAVWAFMRAEARMGKCA